MMNSIVGVESMMMMGCPSSSSSSSSSPFTVSQWEELEHQALIFKYLMAGLSIPPHLVLPIQNSISAAFFHHPTMGYCSFYGKKMDPEPGRCKRTDGKKWRCSKDAYADSKYCERHMNRGRNRSRKLVESSSSQTTISPSLTIGASSAGGGSSIVVGGGGAATLHNRSVHGGYGNSQGGSLAASGSVNPNRVANYYADNIPFGIPNKDYRCAQGIYKAELGDPSHFSGVSVANNAQPTLATRAFPQSFPSNEYASGIQRGFEEEGHSSLRPFFDEWPKARDTSWSGLDDEIRSSNQTAAFSTTQLSISTPVESSDFSTTSSRSPQSEKYI